MRFFRVLIVFCWLLGLGVPEVGAQAAGVFTRMGFGARGVAMSNALVADDGGYTSPFYNPALAPFTARQNLEATAAFLSLDRELQGLQFAAPLRPHAGVAAGLLHAGVSSIDGRDNSGYHTQDYATDEFAFFLAFGTRLGSRLTAGLGLQIFRAAYLEALRAVNSIGLDVGLSWQVTPSLRLGLALDDLLARYAWDTSGLYGSAGKATTDRFPTRVRVGGAYRLMDGRVAVVAEYESRVTVSEQRTRRIDLVGGAPGEVVEAERLRLYEGRFRMGGEYRLAEPFAVRVGLDRIGTGSLEGVQPSAGFMIEQPVGQLVARAEYAFMLETYAASGMHFLTLSIFL